MAGTGIFPAELDLVPTNPLDVSTGEQQQNFLDFLSATYQLPGAQAAGTATIASGSITPTRAVTVVDTEGAAASDDLANAAVSSMEIGRWLVLRAANTARTVVVKHAAGGSGQFLLKSLADFSLDDTEKMIGFYRSGTDWVEMFRSPPAPFDASLVTSGTFANARISAASVRQHFGNGRIQLLNEINITSANTALLNVDGWGPSSQGKLLIHGFAYLATDDTFVMRAQTDASPLSTSNYGTQGRVQDVGSASADINTILSSAQDRWFPFGNLQADENDAIHFFLESVGYALNTTTDFPCFFFRGLMRNTTGPRRTARSELILDGAADNGDYINAIQFFTSGTNNFSSLHAEAWLFDAP